MANTYELGFYSEKLQKLNSQFLKKEYAIDINHQETMKLYWINFLISTSEEDEDNKKYISTKALQYLDQQFYLQFLPFRKY